MKWLRKSLLLASVGYLSAAHATAPLQADEPPGQDAGVILCRPRPLVEIARPVPMPAGVPAFIARGQMADGADRMLPSSADVENDAKARLAAPPLARLGIPVVGSAVEQVQQKDGPAGDNSRTFVAPTPRPLPQYNPWTGSYTGMPSSTGPVIVYESAPNQWFNNQITNPTFYARAEYLLWWTRGYHLPILVTTGPDTVPEAIRGALGAPGTTVLYGGNDTNSGPQSGMRLTFGYNLDPCGNCGIEGNYFFLGRNNDNFYADSSQYPVLARPFFNINTGTPDRELTATPGILPGDAFKVRGSITVNNFSDLQGAELNLRSLMCADCNYSVYSFAGFRYLDLHEQLSITENAVSAMAVPGFPIFNPGNQLVVNDTFATRNQFYGGQVGLDGEYRVGRWFVGSRVQLAVGVTQETITINGSQTVTTLAGVRQVFPGGLLALPSNIGNFTQNKLSFVPQIGFRVGYNVTNNLRVFVGYDFLYWSNVVRPGDQVDTTLNAAQIPNFAPPGFFPPSNIVRPIVPFTTTGFVAQGLNAGLEWRY